MVKHRVLLRPRKSGLKWDRSWIGLLTSRLFSESAPSHPWGQWHIAGPLCRIQLRGSGGFSPRFPFIQPQRLANTVPGSRNYSSPGSLARNIFRHCESEGITAINSICSSSQCWSRLF